MKSLVFKSLVLFVAGIFQIQANAQPAERRISRKEYVSQWVDEAQRQMLEYGVPASITLAQGILESGDGNSPLARYANNHFGIKCHDNWNGETFIQDDDRRDECFRKYNTAGESYRDHSLFLKNRSRYASLFTLDPTDYRGWAKGLKKAGYATNPQYADILIQIIEDNGLNHYDMVNNIAAKKPSVARQEEFNGINQIQHKVKVHDNHIKFIIAKDGDTYYKISKEFELGLWQIYKYNDLSKKDVLQPGDIIYLQPKRNKAQIDTHRVQEGDTMHNISQKYGIKLSKLYKLNNITPGTGEPEPGTLLHLKSRKKA
ncbi:MAG: glucosaminidase domain-containing protein [Flavobacteriales bacterium]